MIPLYFLNGLLMFLLPVALGLYLARRYAVSWRFWWVGAAAMFLAQVGHIPFNFLLTALFRNEILPAPPREWSLVFNAVVLGLSAGLWEEWFRYIAYRWMAKDARSWGQGLMLGAGHGGIEAIVLGLLVLMTLFQMVALRGVDLAAVIPAERLPQVQAQVAQYWATPWYLSLLGVYERVLALTFHLTASVMVLQVFRRGQMRWLWLAVLWHAILDAMAVLLSARDPLLAEAGLSIFILFSLAMLYYLRRRTLDVPPEAPPEAPPDAPTDAAPPTSPAPAAVYPLDPAEPDDLEQSRYQSL